MTFAKRTVCPPQPAVLVTGASSGIGKDCVRAFVAKGWHVFPVVRRPADVDTLRALCPSAACLTPLLGSVTDEASMEEVVKKLTQCLAQGAAQGGAALRLQAVVASAGMGAFAPLELSSLELWREVFEVNVFAVASMSRLLLPLLRDAATSPGPAPRIIVVGSAAGRLPAAIGKQLCL
ncbi:oxidoreductase [Haematococcus lacustris]|uniref:Oxidoreductase n=1 Tax=Haematococcus lacustris TaxID=44745 RepID=A0A6A0ABA1_HAELA|nr:oxidoreductase [Haematococcus lacustris]